jgi:hypothetical protein
MRSARRRAPALAAAAATAAAALLTTAAAATTAPPTALYAIANFDASPEPTLFAPVRIDLSDFSVAVGANFSTSKQHVYCSAAFIPPNASQPRARFLLAAPGKLWEVDADSGAVTTAPGLSARYNLDTVQWDATTARMLAVGWPDADDGNFSAVAVDPSTGRLDVLNSLLVPHNGALPCNTALGASDTLYWTVDLPELRGGIGGYSTATGAQTVDVGYSGDGAVVAIAAYAPPLQPSGEHLLCVDIKGGRGPVITDVDPANGNLNLMIALPEVYDFDSEGGAAWDPVGRTLYLVLTTGNATVGLSNVLALVNVPLNGDKVNYRTVPLPGLPAYTYGVYALNLV